MGNFWSTTTIGQQIESLRLGASISDLDWINSCELIKESRRKTKSGPVIYSTYVYVSPNTDPIWTVAFKFEAGILISARRCIVDKETNVPMTNEDIEELFSIPVGTFYDDMPDFIYDGAKNTICVLTKDGWKQYEDEDNFHIVTDGICTVFEDGYLAHVDQTLA